MRISVLLVLIIAFCSSENSFGQDTLSGKCKFSDTSFYHKKAMGGDIVKAYPSQITHYFSDSLGNRSTKKCKVERFLKGDRSGSETGYYYSEKVYLVNWFGRKYKRPISAWRKKIFASEMPDYSIQYKGYWKSGVKHGLWTYYDRNMKAVRVIEYKNGEIVE